MIAQDAQLTCVLSCHGDKAKVRDLYEYYGPKDCWFNYLLFGGAKECAYGCLGYGHCVKVCPSSAIKFGDDGLPVIDPTKCNGCGICVKECPRGVLKLIPASHLVYLKCSSIQEKEKIKEICKVACTDCGICVKVCPYGAVTIKENLPRIDFTKCTSCGICVHKCPHNVFEDRAKARPYAIISLKCNGCGECKKVCQFDAIQGEKNKRHIVNRERCIGCGMCFEVCEIQAITMAGALGYSASKT